MKKLLLITCLLTAFTSVSAQKDSDASAFYNFMSKSPTIQVDTKNDKGGMTTQGLWCENNCRSRYNACMSRPDPHQVNVDVCGMLLNACLNSCNNGGVYL